MKSVVFFTMIGMGCAAGVSENAPWKEIGKPIPARPDLGVRWDTPSNYEAGWNVPTNAWPSKMWIYHLSPRKYPSEVVSNLMVMCSLAEKDRTDQDTNRMTFQSSNGSRRLSIFFPAGAISYETANHHYGPTNLAKGVPEMSRMPELTMDFLAKVGIDLSDIEKNSNGAPNFNFWEPLKLYFVNGGTITNIEFRAVVFSRSVDGAKVLGDAGHCGLEFGEHGRISQIHLSWPKLEHSKLCPTLKPQTMMQLLRQGKARLGFVPDDFGDTDWAGVKSVTIKKAIPSYYAGSSDWLYPYMFLWATVQTGHGNVDVEIHCPIIDETKP